MSKTFNKNIQYTFNPQIVLPTSSGLTITGNSNTIGNIFTTGGNVGIGTTTPGSALHVTGLIPTIPTGNGVHMGIDSANSNYTAIQLNGGTSTSGICYIDFGYSGVDYGSKIVHNNNNKSLSFDINSGTRVLTLASSGNVGINTTSPLYSLQVDGEVALNVMPGINSVGSIKIGRQDFNARWHMINCNNGTSASLNTMIFNLHDAVTSTSNTPVLALRGDGYVGITTTAPATSLHIFDADPILRIQHNSGTTAVNSGTLDLMQSNLTGIRMRYDGASDVFVMQHLSTGVTQANAVISMDTGNVGIRNSAPAYNLDVTGNFRTTGIIYSNDTTSVSVTANNYSTTSGSVNISGDIVIPGSNELMFTSTGVATPSLNGRSSGTKLVLYPDTNITRGDYSMGIETRNMWFQVPSSREGFKFYQGTSANFVMGTDGNIGIGVTNPGGNLAVRYSSWGAIRTLPETSGTESAIGFFSNADGSTGTGATTSNWLMGINLTGYPIGQFNIRNNGLGSASIFTIATNGNIGIGTTAPSTDLQVNGAITKSTYNSGEVIQSKCYSSAIGTSFTTSISGTYPVVVSTLSFTPLSSSSYIMVSVDCTYGVGGSSGDSFQSGITIAGTTVITKSQTWYASGTDVSTTMRNNNNSLFPLMGIAPNTSTTAKTIQVLAGRVTSDDTLTLSNINIEIREIRQ